MTYFASLGTLTDAQRKPRAESKGLPAVLTKPEKKKAKETLAREFRRAVWIRDRGRSRATGKPLAHSGTDYDKVGEVHHVLKRSTHPDQVYDVANGLLISKTEHVLAETACPLAPEHCLLTISGPDDRGKLQTFTWRDRTGKILKQRIG